MRRIALCTLLVLGLVLVGGPAAGQGKKGKTKNPKDIPGTGAKEKGKAPKDAKTDPGGKFPTEIAGKDLDAWVKAIRDHDPSVRQEAMRTVVHFGPPARKKAVPNLILALRETDVGLRSEAASALGFIGMEDVDMSKGIAGLTLLLGDTQRSMRAHAAYALGHFGFHAKSATASLCRTLGTDIDSWEVRKACAFALGHVAYDKNKGVEPQAIRALISALKDPAVPVRLEALNSLSFLGLPQLAALVASEKKALEERVYKDRDKSVIVWARVLLMLLDEKTYLTPKGLDFLANFLDDEDVAVRCHAAQALGRIGPKAQAKVSEVMAAVGDKEASVAMVALTSLGNMEDPKAVKVLVKTLKDKDAARGLRCQAAVSIGALRSFGKDGLPALMEMLTVKETDIVFAAMNALAQMGPTARPAIADLKKLSAHKDELIRKAAEEAIKILNEDPKDKDKEKKKK